MRRVLVLSPHPDDDAIGCGGTLRKHVTQGDEVFAVYLTSGEQGGHGRSPADTSKVREAEAQMAAKILGIQHIEFWHEPDGALPIDEALQKKLLNFLNQWKPDIIYTPHENETHRDHKAAAQLVKGAISCLKAPVKPVVRFFEIWTPLQRMHHVEDISAEMETKLAAIRAYQSQCEIMRFDEAILGLNRYRGEMHSWPGGDYAEVFEILG